MNTIPPSETIRYGLHLMGYQLFVFLAGGLAIGIGVSLGSSYPVLATIIVLSGLAVIFTGAMLILYMVIRDAMSATIGDSMALPESEIDH